MNFPDAQVTVVIPVIRGTRGHTQVFGKADVLDWMHRCAGLVTCPRPNWGVGKWWQCCVGFSMHVHTHYMHIKNTLLGGRIWIQKFYWQKPNTLDDGCFNLLTRGILPRCIHTPNHHITHFKDTLQFCHFYLNKAGGGKNSSTGKAILTIVMEKSRHFS